MALLVETVDSSGVGKAASGTGKKPKKQLAENNKIIILKTTRETLLTHLDENQDKSVLQAVSVTEKKKEQVGKIVILLSKNNKSLLHTEILNHSEFSILSSEFKT